MLQSLKEHRALLVVLLMIAGVAGLAAVTFRSQDVAVRSADTGVAASSQDVAQSVAPAAVSEPAKTDDNAETIVTMAGEPVQPSAEISEEAEPDPEVEIPIAAQAPIDTSEPETTAPKEAAVEAQVDQDATAVAEPETAEIANQAQEPEPTAPAVEQGSNAPKVKAEEVLAGPELTLKASEAAGSQLKIKTPQTQEIAALAPALPKNGAAESVPQSLKAPEVQADPVSAATSPTEGEALAPVEIEDRYKPRFDLVRVEPDGSAVVAGKAPAGAVVTIFSEGIELGQATATNRGEFVAFVNTIPEQEVQSLELRAQLVDGPVVVSDDTVLLLAKTQTEDLSLPEAETPVQAPTVVKATSEGISVVQSPDLAVLDHVSLDTIGYDAEGEVVLTGRGTPGQRVFVYADGKPVGANSISQTGSWRMVMVNLTAGRYLLRVDEVDPEGSVLSRVESPFQRVFPEDELTTAGLTQSNVIVQPGSNLWTIARLRYGSGVKYTQIYQANRDRIRNPDLIYPGQIFDLPDDQ